MGDVMKRALFLATMCLAALPAHAGWYLGPHALVGFADTDNVGRNDPAGITPTSSTDTMGLNVGGGLWAGYDFTEHGAPFSLEFSGNYRFRHDMTIDFIDVATAGSFSSKSNVETYDFVVSGLYDLPLGTKWQPYIGAGAGIMHARLENEVLRSSVLPEADSSNTNFVWQLQGGVKYPIGESSKFRIDYRYVDMGRLDTGAYVNVADGFQADLTSHDVRVGVTWGF